MVPTNVVGRGETLPALIKKNKGFGPKADALGVSQGQKAFKPGFNSSIDLDLAQVIPNAQGLSRGALQDVQATLGQSIAKVRAQGIPVSSQHVEALFKRPLGSTVDDFVQTTLGINPGTAQYKAAVKQFKAMESTVASARGRASRLAESADIARKPWIGKSKVDKELANIEAAYNKAGLPFDSAALREQVLRQVAGKSPAEQTAILEKLKNFRNQSTRSRSMQDLENDVLQLTGRGGASPSKYQDEARKALGIDEIRAGTLTGKLNPAQEQVLSRAVANSGNPQLLGNFQGMQNLSAEVSALEQQIKTLGNRATQAQRNQLTQQLAGKQQQLATARQNVINDVNNNPTMFDSIIADDAASLAQASRMDDLAAVGAPTRKLEKAEMVAEKARRASITRNEPAAMKEIERRILNPGTPANPAHEQALEEYARLKGMTTEELIARRTQAITNPGEAATAANENYRRVMDSLRSRHKPLPEAPASPLAPPTATPGAGAAADSGGVSALSPSVGSWLPPALRNNPYAALSAGIGGGMVLNSALN
jgi:hypothetical protein